MAQNARTQNRVISHTGSELGDDKVTLSQNTVDSLTPVVSWECPKEYEQIEFVGQRDSTRFVPRTMQTITGTANDDTVVALDNDIQPVAGETELSEQDYPAVVAYNVTQGAEVDIASVNYASDEATLATDPADGDEVKLYPILNEGEIRFHGINQFGQDEGTLYPWSTPLYRFHDFQQDKAGREINLRGRVSWSRYESVEVRINSPHQIVWEDPDYPLGGYVSSIDQDVRVTL